MRDEFSSGESVGESEVGDRAVATAIGELRCERGRARRARLFASRDARDRLPERLEHGVTGAALSMRVVVPSDLGWLGQGIYRWSSTYRWATRGLLLFHRKA